VVAEQLPGRFFEFEAQPFSRSLTPAVSAVRCCRTFFIHCFIAPTHPEAKNVAQTYRKKNNHNSGRGLLRLTGGTIKLRETSAAEARRHSYEVSADTTSCLPRATAQLRYNFSSWCEIVPRLFFCLIDTPCLFATRASSKRLVNSHIRRNGRQAGRHEAAEEDRALLGQLLRGVHAGRNHCVRAHAHNGHAAGPGNLHSPPLLYQASYLAFKVRY
jgi:hypothetical protein